MKKSVSVTVHQDSGVMHSLPSNASEFVAFFQKHIDSVPEEYRKTTTIEFDLEPIPYTDNDTITMKIVYYRPETDEEYARRVHEEKRKSAEERDRKLQQLERLKKELGET